MDSTRYILIFTLSMCIISALVLSGMFYATKPSADKNQLVFNKRAVLSAVSSHLDKKLDEMSDDEVQQAFKDQIEEITLNMQGEPVKNATIAEKIDLAQEKKKPEKDRLLPLFIFTAKDGKKYYILSVRGNGLWDEIWGNIALEGDLNTVAGASFDHKGETPGLGAEIKDNPAFRAQFVNKKIYDDSGKLVSIIVRKGGAQDPVHEVDAVSGATLTSNGVTEMLKRGLSYYEPYLNKLRTQNAQATGMK